MPRKKSQDLKIVGLIATAILLLIATQFIGGTASILSTQGIGSEYSYTYKPFSEDYVTLNTSYTTNESGNEATWLFRHDTDKAYPQNVSMIQAGVGGLWIDAVNNQTYYDIQKEDRTFYIYGTCTMDSTIQATNITEETVGGVKGIKCTFPPISDGLQHTYAANLKIEFKPPCATDTFNPATCDKAWYIAPFISGKHITGWDYNHCATHRCEDDVQWLNIVVVLLAVAAIIILAKRRMSQ